MTFDFGNMYSSTKDKNPNNVLAGLKGAGTGFKEFTEGERYATEKYVLELEKLVKEVMLSNKKLTIELNNLKQEFKKLKINTMNENKSLMNKITLTKKDISTQHNAIIQELKKYDS